MNEPSTITNSTLGGDLGGLDGLLDNLAKARERDRVQIALGACLAEVKDRTNDINALFAENRRSEAIRLTKILIGGELEAAGYQRIVVPEYVQKGRAKQVIYVYLGTHWEMVSMQVFYDFCREGAKRMGLSDLYANDQNFMCDVFENVAFRTSRHLVTVQPEGGVWINLKNCTVEINSDGTIATHDHRPEDFFMYCLPYSYNPKAKCKLWHTFLDEVLPDKETQTLLGEYIGYCFTRNVKLEKMAVFYGTGANGKSVVMDVLRQLFGRMNVSESTLSSLTTDPEARALLQNKLVNISSESGKNIDSAILKMIVSGEAVEMRILYVGTKMLENPPKLITSYNELPPMENTYGYRRRWLLFPFEKAIAEDRQDPALANKLCVELPGILNWCLALLAKLLKRVARNSGEGFSVSNECNSAMSVYARSSNSVWMFLEECCTIDSENIYAVKVKDAYNSYTSYCKASGITKPFTQKKFKQFAVEWGAKVSSYKNTFYLNINIDSSNYE